MLKIREAIIVEGRYDKNTLRQIVDAPVLETSGFGIFNDRERLALLRRLAETRGLIVLTDSDGAGFMIRNFLRGAIDPACIKHAYIPDVAGKERRKRTPSREGKLGVEGMRPEVLLEALRRAGATIEGEASNAEASAITKADLYEAGLSGGAGSAQARRRLLRFLNLPERLSANAMLEVLGALMDRNTFLDLARSLREGAAADV